MNKLTVPLPTDEAGHAREMSSTQLARKRTGPTTRLSERVGEANASGARGRLERRRRAAEEEAEEVSSGGLGCKCATPDVSQASAHPCPWLLPTFATVALQPYEQVSSRFGGKYGSLLFTSE